MNPTKKPWIACIMVILSAGLLAGCASALEPGEVDARAAVYALDAEYVARWKAGDADGVMALFAEGAAVVPHHGVEPVVGLEAIRAYWFPEDQPAAVIPVFEHRPDEVIVEGDMAVVRGRFTLAWSYEGAQTKIPDGNYLLIAVRKSDDWKIGMFSWNDDPDAWVIEQLE